MADENPALSALKGALERAEERLEDARNEENHQRSRVLTIQRDLEEATNQLTARSNNVRLLENERSGIMQGIRDLEAAATARKEKRARLDATLGVGI